MHPSARRGLILFNRGDFFEAHEALEQAWLEEAGPTRDLYRGILQVAVVYLHVCRGNYDGAVKVFDRCMKWLRGWPEVCRGIGVGRLREDAARVIREVIRLGRGQLGGFDSSLFKPVEWTDARTWLCDRCGSRMIETNCKVVCLNCGNRFDCSDLNLNFD